MRQLFGSNFSVKAAHYEEDNTISKDPISMVQKHASCKAFDVARRTKHGICIGADTLVLLKGKVLGKPKDAMHAKRMLKLISKKGSNCCDWYFSH